MIGKQEINGKIYYRIIPKDSKFSAFCSGYEDDITYESPFILPSTKDEWLSKKNSICSRCYQSAGYDIYDGSDYGDITCLECGKKFVFYDWDVEKELIKKFDTLMNENKELKDA